MLTARLFLKLILAVLVVLALALTGVNFLTGRLAERSYTETLRLDLFEKARLLESLDPNANQEAVRRAARLGAARLTIIRRDGTVLADSDANPERMENHGSRPEVKAALTGRDGWSVRLSPTLKVQFLYVAVPLHDGALRLAVPLSKITKQVNEIRKQVLASTALAFLPSVLLAALFARRVSARLGRIVGYAGRLSDGDFSARLTETGKDELGTLAAKLNETGSKLEGTFRQLQQEHKALERLEQVRKDFVINVSHELRTPLASIQGYAETLLEGAIHDPHVNLQFVQIILQNAQRLGRLTADLLTLSRIELQQKTFQFAPYSINALLNQHVQAIRPLAEQKHIELSLDPAPGEPEAFCDEEAMHQILTNLVDNALKYTPDRGSVRVAARAISADEIEISVSDSGIGLPAEELPRLFERFYRVDKARSRELGGTGLGLAIVKHLVRAQGGEVGVESTPGLGSRFYFTVPTQDLGIAEVQAAYTGSAAL
ncbi:MAG: ATP-binding protein [Acidobacteriota bacterium]|nr:ATP-binding protein [Acidobacteriota bacterium]